MDVTAKYPELKTLAALLPGEWVMRGLRRWGRWGGDGAGGGVLGGLRVEHGGVAPVGGHEFVVASVFDESSVVQDVNAVGVADAGHAVGDQDDGPVRGGEPADAVEGGDLGFRVEGGGRAHPQ